MKIGLIAPFFLPEIGGANLYCFELARALGKAGHDVHVFSVPNALAHPSYRLHPILTRKLEQDIPTLLKHDLDVWHSLFFYYAPLALHRSNVISTVHGDDGFSFQLRYRLPGRDALNKHLLWRLTDDLRHKMGAMTNQIEFAYNKRIFTRAVNKLAGVITVSTFTRDRFAEQYPGALRKTTVIPPGVSERFFAGEQGKHDPCRLLTVTRLDETDRIKNVHNVISALGKLKDRYAFRYSIISGTVTGRYKDELVAMICDLGLEERVFIEGRKSNEELMDYYRQAGLFILCSYSEKNNFEGFGIVFLEANACGVPVLTTRDGGMRDYVREGVNGLYVQEPTAQGIEEALDRYFRGEVKFYPETMRQLPQDYRWERIADRILEVYQSC